jgi:hypothetical protein
LAKKLTELRVDEVSLVDVPANPGANVLLLKRNTPTPQKENGNMSDVTKQLAELQSEVARLQKMAKMTDEERLMLASMTEDEQKEYMDGDDEMKSKLKAKYTKAEGKDEDESAKADGEVEDEETAKALKKMQSAVDVALAKAEAVSAENAHMKLEKRAAAELASLPGELAEKVSMLKAIDALPKAERESAMATLKKAGEICQSYTKSLGNSQARNEDSAEAKLEKMAKEIAASEKITQPQAFAKALRTREGSKLYAEINKQ